MYDDKVKSRFWAKVDKGEGPDACWTWTACKFKAGYGAFGLERRLRTAHRVSWEIHHGPIPDGLWVLHKCDNRPCVRPDHLFLGTPTDNARDMTDKGRGNPPRADANWMRKTAGIQVGDNNFNAKLTAETVTLIKIAIVAGEKNTVIAQRHGMSSPAISLIASGTNWKDVPWPDGASFAIDGDRALRARGVRRSAAARTGGVCSTGCGRSTTGGRERCDECWATRRTESKTDNARASREEAREAAAP